MAPDGYPSLWNHEEGKCTRKAIRSFLLQICVLNGNRLFWATLTELQLKINFISRYENISTNPISWMASPVIHFTATIGTYKEIAKPLTHATTLPLKHGKFISSSLISSLTTLQKRSKLSWTKKVSITIEKAIRKVRMECVRFAPKLASNDSPWIAWNNGKFIIQEKAMYSRSYTQGVTEHADRERTFTQYGFKAKQDGFEIIG